MEQNDTLLRDKTQSFAIRVINAYKYLNTEKKEFALSEKLLVSGATIGAKVAAAQAAGSGSMFHTLMTDALTESAMTKYWIELLFNTGYIDKKISDSMSKDVDDIVGMISPIIRAFKLAGA